MYYFRSSLFDICEIEQSPMISIIGGGGKTSFMFALAREIREKKQRYPFITTTSTKIYYPSLSQSPNILIEPDISKVIQSLKKHSFQDITIASKIRSDRKLEGFSALEFVQLKKILPQYSFLIEADGALGRSLKAHHATEPVIPPINHLIVAIVGLDILNQPLNEQFVHHSKLFRDRLQLEENKFINIEDIINILKHPKGYFHNAPKQSQRIVLFNKMDVFDNTEKIAQYCLEQLQCININKIVLGSLQSDALFDVYKREQNLEFNHLEID